MTRTAPELELQAVLRSNWDASETSLAEAPAIHTGQYERGDSPVPAITITDGNEGPIGGGETGYTALDGAGRGGTQRISGARTVDCIAGSYDDLASAGTSGESLNPKQVRWELYDQAAQLFADHQLETDLLWISPGDATVLTQSYGTNDELEWIFSIQFRARYGYDRRPR